MSDNPERDAFDAGARAMRSTPARGSSMRGGTRPRPGIGTGHPHHLEMRIRAAQIEHLEGRP